MAETSERKASRIRFKELRQQANLTQEEIAGRLDIRQNTVSTWDRGTWPHARHLPALAHMFHCTIEELYGLPRP